MNRRELLKAVAILTGGVVIGGEVFLTGCKTGAKTEFGFTANNIALLDEVADTILPTTASSPGAKAAKVGEFMKIFVTDCYTEQDQKAFNEGLIKIEDACKEMHGKSFMDCSPEQRHEFLLMLEKESKEYNSKRDQPDDIQDEQAEDEKKEKVIKPVHYYSMMKQLTLLGYFTSEIGATKAMRHLPIPGRYDGAYPYKKGDKAFARS